MRMYDVIVVGARCGETSLAAQLARRGARVLLVDQTTFPSDTTSAHALKKPGVATLTRLGVLDRVLATGCPPFRTMVLDAGPLRLEGEAPPAGDVDITIAPRHTVLDAILVEAAATAGAEVRED